MKCTIPEISWHNRDPILSVDIQPVYNEEFYRLASGGTDCHVLIWYLKIRKNGAVDVDVVSDLNRHQRAVNVVRWSPSGKHLATGDDDANIIIWNLKTDNIPLLEGETSDKETWVVTKVLRGHKEDVYDICWSPNGMKLLSGSIDNTAILWDFAKGLNENILSDHKGFVQGVAWDPKGQYIATLSSDRVCRVFDNTGKHVKSRTHKGLLPLPESHVLFNKEVKYFHDDTFKSYFRRLNFSPDGSLLIAPSGCIETDDYKAARHTTLVFTLDCLTQPIVVLPSPKQETIAVRCCPVLFELHSEGDDPIIVLPYRIVIAVATDSDIVLYDTQQLAPFAHLQKVHYTRITDLTWSADGLLLIASSTDGYCTLVTFEPNELGVQYVKEESETEESPLNVSGCEELDKTEGSNKKSKEKEQIEAKAKKPNLLEQWAIRKSKGDILKEGNARNISKGKVVLEKPAVTEPKLVDVGKNDVGLKNKARKRIVPTKIEELQNKSCTIKNSQEVKTISHSVTKDVKKETVTDKTTKQEESSSNDDVIVIDDCSLKENKPDLSLSTNHTDCKSELPINKKKEKLCDTTPSRKRKIETKINKSNQKSSPLLKFFQTKTKLEFSNENKTTSEVIDISDDEDATPTQENVKKCSKLEDVDKKMSKIKEVIDIDDSDSNTASNNVCDDGNHSNINTETVKSEIYVEKHDKDHNSIKTTEMESMETDEICIDTTSNEDDIKQTSTKSEAKTSEVHSSKKKKVKEINTSKTVVFEKKENMEAANSNKDTEKLAKSETRVNKLRFETENSGSGSKVNSLETQPSKSKNTEKSCTAEAPVPVKIATPKTPRRIALVTLASPKRKKKM